MKRIKDALLRLDYAVCAVYLIDAQFIEVHRQPRTSLRVMSLHGLSPSGAIHLGATHRTRPNFSRAR